MSENLEQELNDLIVETCRVAEPLPTEIDPDAPLIGPDSPYGLDSLDAVEVVVAVQKRYSVRIDSQETSRQVLRSIRTLADHIRKSRG